MMYIIGFYNFIKRTVLYFNELVVCFLNVVIKIFMYTDTEPEGGIYLERPFFSS